MRQEVLSGQKFSGNKSFQIIRAGAVFIVSGILINQTFYCAGLFCQSSHPDLVTVFGFRIITVVCGDICQSAERGDDKGGAVRSFPVNKDTPGHGYGGGQSSFGAINVIRGTAAGRSDDEKSGVAGFIKLLFGDIQCYQPTGIRSGPGFFCGVPLIVAVQVCINVGIFDITVKNMKGKINGLFPVAVISTAATAAASAAGGQGNG